MTFEEYIEQRLHVGSIPVPKKTETRHFFVIGRSGTGKTRLIYSFLEKIRKQQAKTIIYDFKGDYVSCFFNPETDFLFNPLDLRTIHWCPFLEVETLADIDSVSMSLIPTSSRDDKFWIDGARDVFSAILYYLKSTGQILNEDIWKHVSLTEEEMLNLMVGCGPAGI